MWMWRYQKNETTQKSGKNPRSPLFSSSPWSKMTCHYYFSSFLFLMVVVFRCHLAASSSVPFPYNHCCVRYTLNKQQRQQQPLIYLVLLLGIAYVSTTLFIPLSFLFPLDSYKTTEGRVRQTSCILSKFVMTVCNPLGYLFGWGAKKKYRDPAVTTDKGIYIYSM